MGIAKYIKEAEKTFGTTNNPAHLFYIMPDGLWLDGSGAHWMDTEEEKQQHRNTTRSRQADHGDVGELSFISTSGVGAMLDFMYLCDAARADTISGYLAIMQGNKYFKKIVQSYAKARQGQYAAVAIYSQKGYIVAETEFENIQPRKLQAWYEEHMNDKPTQVRASLQEVKAIMIEEKDTITLDIPLIMRLFELCREGIKDDVHLHTLTEALITLQMQKDVISMEDYPAILKIADIKGDVGY